MVTVSAPRPQLVVHTAASIRLAVNFAVPPIAWSIYAGSLPTGMTLTNDGVISGTLTTQTPGTVQIMAIDSTGEIGVGRITFEVFVAQLLLVEPDFSSLQDGVPYTGTVSATGGVQPYTFSVSSGSLPAGLTLTAETGAIDGTPTTSGAGSVTFAVEDSQSTIATTVHSATNYVVAV